MTTHANQPLVSRPGKQQVLRALRSADVWREIDKASFAILAYTSPKGEPRSSGVSFKSDHHRLYVVVDPESWKARHIAQRGLVSVTVPIRRGGILTLALPIPPATISFQAKAVVHPACAIEDAPSLPKELVSLLPVDRRTVGRVIEIEPVGEFLTYGIGVPLMTMKEPRMAQGRVQVE